MFYLQEKMRGAPPVEIHGRRPTLRRLCPHCFQGRGYNGFPIPEKKPSTFFPAPFNFHDADFCLRRPPPGPLPRTRQGHPTVGVPEQHAQKQVWQKYGTLFTIQY